MLLADGGGLEVHLTEPKQNRDTGTPPKEADWNLSHTSALPTCSELVSGVGTAVFASSASIIPSSGDCTPSSHWESHPLPALSLWFPWC